MKHLSLLLASSFILHACSALSSGENEAPRLQGERISILDLQTELSPSAKAQNSAINILPAIANEDWPQASGYPHHAMQNLSVGDSASLGQIWRSSIGQGSTKEIPLNAKPVVASGKIFAIDGRNKVHAFNAQTGQKIWVQNVKSLTENDNVIAGGLAHANNVLFVTSGYDEILALNPEDGEIYWRTKISSGSRAAPTVINGRVFVTTMNNKAVALDASNGNILWEYEGVGETTGLLGAASPAANEQIVVPAFSNGDILALRVENGATIWEDSLANSLRLGGMAGLSDIRGNPVIIGDLVIAISYGNKMAAFDKNNGARIWQREISSAETPWVSGNVVYVLTADSKVVALDITSGDIIWISALPKYKNPDAYKGLIHWTGPIMMNSKLLFSGTAGRILEIDPITGQETNRWDVKKDISLPPIIAGGTLYILTDDGTLSAYR